MGCASKDAVMFETPYELGNGHLYNAGKQHANKHAQGAHQITTNKNNNKHCDGMHMDIL